MNPQDLKSRIERRLFILNKRLNSLEKDQKKAEDNMDQNTFEYISGQITEISNELSFLEKSLS
jgi:hypothetical protein